MILDTIAIIIFVFVLVSPPLIYMLDRFGFESADGRKL